MIILSKQTPLKFGLVVSQTRLPRPDNRLRPIGHLQLAEDIRDVIAHRLQAQPQLRGDLRIVQALRDQAYTLDVILYRVAS